MEPDDDEDATRRCAKCGLRPRWSKHGSCRRCAVCAGKAVRWCILTRIHDTPIPLNRSACSVRRRARYTQLRARGASVEQARIGSQSGGVFARAVALLGDTVQRPRR